MAASIEEICNEALALLGAQPIVSINDQNDRARLCKQLYDRGRRYVLKDHAWNFAVVYAVLKAWTEPTTSVTPGAGATIQGTTGVDFVALAGVFTLDDVGKRITNPTDKGVARITALVTNTTVETTIEHSFSSLAAIPSGSWRLYEIEPAHTYDFSLALPSNFLRFKDLQAEDLVRYKLVSNSFVYADSDEMEVVYIKDETDTTKFELLFEDTLAAYLAQRLALPITGQLETMRNMSELYRIKLAEARTLDSQQGSPDDSGSNILNRVRHSSLFSDRDRFWGNLP